MVSYTDLFPSPAKCLLSKPFVDEGAFDYFVPNDPRIKWMIAVAEGCGGMGDSIGGGGAQAKNKVPVTPGELLKIQVGKPSTQSVLGDSFVKRANNTVIVSADRGRGSGAAGLAANSTGLVKRDGYSSSATPSSNIGAPASDVVDLKSEGLGGFGYFHAQGTLGQAADFGGGGRLVPQLDGDGEFSGSYVSEGAGSGYVSLRFFDEDPGALN